MRPEAWEKLTEDPDAGGLFAALLMLGSDLNELAVEGGELTPEEAEQLLEDGPELIPDAVIGIYEFWSEQRSKATSPKGTSGQKDGFKNGGRGGKSPRGN